MIPSLYLLSDPPCYRDGAVCAGAGGGRGAAALRPGAVPHGRGPRQARHVVQEPGRDSLLHVDR